MISLKVAIIWEYQIKRQQTTLQSNIMRIEDALFLTKDFEKTGRVKDIYYLDEEGTTWTKKELEKLAKGIETEPHDVTAYFDGGFDLESQLAGLGIVIYYTKDGKRYRLRKNEVFREIESNNEAEYAALHFLVQQLEEIGIQDQAIFVQGDSQVVINQMSGEWPVFEEEFVRWQDRIEDKLKVNGLRAHFELLGRKGNKEADHLAGQALQEKPIHSVIEIQLDES
jgi:ribonuclease HI